MYKFNFRLFIALLTFGIGILVASFWLVNFNTLQISPEEEVVETEIIGFDEVVTAKDRIMRLFGAGLTQSYFVKI